MRDVFCVARDIQRQADEQQEQEEDCKNEEDQTDVVLEEFKNTSGHTGRLLAYCIACAGA